MPTSQLLCHVVTTVCSIGQIPLRYPARKPARELVRELDSVMAYGLIVLSMFNILHFSQLIKFSRLKLHDIKQWTTLEIKRDHNMWRNITCQMTRQHWKVLHQKTTDNDGDDDDDEITCSLRNVLNERLCSEFIRTCIKLPDIVSPFPPFCPIYVLDFLGDRL